MTTMDASRPPRVLAFAGSARRGSLNRRLVDFAAGTVREAGVECTVLDLADYPLPLYDADLEAAEGLPPAAAALRERFLEHDALLIAAPEYNSSITPLLKNTLDWVSRGPGGEGDLAPYRGKLAALLAASPGALGGLRGLVTVRSILGNIGVTVIPEQFALARAGEAFDPAGGLADSDAAARVRRVGAALAGWLKRLERGAG